MRALVATIALLLSACSVRVETTDNVTVYAPGAVVAVGMCPPNEREERQWK